MKRINVLYTKEASKDLLKLDRHIARKIVQKIKFYSVAEKPLAHSKGLTGAFSGLFRFRIGDYRAIFEVNESGVMTILTILTIKHRKEIYKAVL